MKIKDLYIQLALTYRLSLHSMMKITGKSHEEIYNEFILGSDYFHALQYLFESETAKEDETLTKQNYLMAKSFIKKYKCGSKEVKQRLIFLLYDVEYQMKKIKAKILNNENLDEDDKNTLTKYRIKYGLSKRNIKATYGYDLQMFESGITDPIIQNKLRILNDYSKKSGNDIQQKKK